MTTGYRWGGMFRRGVDDEQNELHLIKFFEISQKKIPSSRGLHFFFIRDRTWRQGRPRARSRRGFSSIATRRVRRRPRPAGAPKAVDCGPHLSHPPLPRSRRNFLNIQICRSFLSSSSSLLGEDLCDSGSTLTLPHPRNGASGFPRGKGETDWAGIGGKGGHAHERQPAFCPATGESLLSSPPLLID